MRNFSGTTDKGTDKNNGDVDFPGIEAKREINLLKIDTKANEDSPSIKGTEIQEGYFPDPPR